jgi:hypothetical protein
LRRVAHGDEEVPEELAQRELDGVPSFLALPDEESD